MTGQRFQGVYPILYAFYGRDGRLDRGAMRRQVEACVASGAHGLAILGLITEGARLSREERLQVLTWAAADLDGRLPLAVTVGDVTIDGQVDFLAAARDAGAAWAILQPPPVKGTPESEVIAFMSAVMAQTELPLAIQNFPGVMDVWLSHDGLLELKRRHAHFTLMKGEGPAVTVAELIRRAEGAFDVFSGQGGMEFIDSLDSGCAGMIPALDVMDAQARIFDLMRAGTPADRAEAVRLHREILPVIVFMMQSIAHALCYGKRLTARRLGLPEITVRQPELPPTAFGLSVLDRFYAQLGPLP
jgi:4-hydroxy-tetrahydrodipicolinate synthase